MSTLPASASGTSGSVSNSSTTVAQQKTNLTNLVAFLADLFGSSDSSSAKANVVDTLLANGSGTASITAATTTNLASLANIRQVTITNSATVAISAFGTVMAGAEREVLISNSGTLTLTHNATSLIIPGGENITLYDGDQLRLVSLGSGNWRVRNIVRSSTGIARPMTLGTAVASTSGTSVAFTGIPSWAKRITIMLAGVSTNGSSNLLVQVGSGSYTTTGYDSTASAGANASQYQSSTSGFLVTYPAQAASCHFKGIVTLVHMGSTVWVEAGNVSDSVYQATHSGSSGNVTLGGVLDRLRLTTVNGTDTFDAGSVNIMYEG